MGPWVVCALNAGAVSPINGMLTVDAVSDGSGVIIMLSLLANKSRAFLKGTHTAEPPATQRLQTRSTGDQHRSHATIFRATFCPHKTTIGMPPPGFTEPPTKKRFGYFVLCFGALKARFLNRSQTTP